MVTATTSEIDRALADLDGKAEEWVQLPISRRLEYLDQIRGLIAEHAAEWVDAAVKGKQIPEGSPYVGEEWISGPYPTLGWINACAETLEAPGLRIRSAGRNQDKRTRRRAGDRRGLSHQHL